MYQNDIHAYNFPKFFVYVIDMYMPNSLQDEYGMVGIRDKWVDIAIKLNKPFVVIAPKGSATFNPKQLKKEYKNRLFKQVGYFRDNPMLMYPLQVFNNEDTDIDKWRFA